MLCIIHAHLYYREKEIEMYNFAFAVLHMTVAYEMHSKHIYVSEQNFVSNCRLEYLMAFECDFWSLN